MNDSIQIHPMHTMYPKHPSHHLFSEKLSITRPQNDIRSASAPVVGSLARNGFACKVQQLVGVLTVLLAPKSATRARADGSSAGRSLFVSFFGRMLLSNGAFLFPTTPPRQRAHTRPARPASGLGHGSIQILPQRPSLFPLRLARLLPVSSIRLASAQSPVCYARAAARRGSQPQATL